mmetsp:Transcript_65059/g.130861  ORF Transcript_65059/g.130861 Transcript_65059/m.130861 type:complete len:214 (-) Transcript_65059:79-720(-)
MQRPLHAVRELADSWCQPDQRHLDGAEQHRHHLQRHARHHPEGRQRQVPRPGRLQGDRERPRDHAEQPDHAQELPAAHPVRGDQRDVLQHLHRGRPDRPVHEHRPVRHRQAHQRAGDPGVREERGEGLGRLQRLALPHVGVRALLRLLLVQQQAELQGRLRRVHGLLLPRALLCPRSADLARHGRGRHRRDEGGRRVEAERPVPGRSNDRRAG